MGAIHALKAMAVLLFAVSTFADQAQQAQQLISYFGSGCSVQGDWTKGALSQAQALIATLESIQKDPACQSTAGSIAQLNQLKDLTYRLSYSSNESEILAHERAEQELLLAYSEADITQKPLILSQLRFVQIELAKLTGYETADKANLRLSEHQQSLDLLVAGTQTLLQQTVANQSCWTEKPALLQGIGSLVGAVASSAASASLALPLSAGVQLTGMIIDFARKMKISKQINTIARGLQATAYQCTFESLAQQWCGANDAINAIELKARATVSKEPEDVLWEGVKLIDRDLPVLLDWLEQVRAGVEPANLSAAEMQARVLTREKIVKSARPLGVGIIEGNRTLYQKATTNQDKWIIERTTITSVLDYLGICSGCSMDSAGNPLSEIYDRYYVGYYLLGLTRVEYATIKAANGGNDVSLSSFDPLSQWPRTTPYTPDLDAIKQRLLAWISKAEDKVRDEFSSVFQIDPLQIVTDAVTVGLKGDSPKDSLKKTIEFLKLQLTNMTGLPAGYKTTYSNTISRLEKILIEIESVFDPTILLDPVVALKNIQQLAQLEYGVVFIGGRLERSIRLSLNALVQNGTGIDQDLASQFLAAGNIVNDLQKYSGNKGLEVMKFDAENSQSLTQNSLRAFSDVFSKYITATLENYDAQAKSAGEDENGANKRAKAALCLKLLAVETWPKEIPFKLCEGAQLHSVFPNGPSSLKVTRELAAKRLPERICTFRNFLRSSRIFGEYYKNPKVLKQLRSL